MIGPYSRLSFSRREQELQIDNMFGTVRMVAHSFVYDYDTMRRIVYLFENDYDTLKTVANLCMPTFRTVRKIGGGYFEKTFDTVRRIFKRYPDDRYPICYPATDGKRVAKKCGVCAKCQGSR